MTRLSKYLAILPICLAPFSAQAGDFTPVPAQKPIRLAMLCILTGEQTSNMNKICYYDCAGSAAAITVSAVALCPLSINQ